MEHFQLFDELVKSITNEMENLNHLYRDFRKMEHFQLILDCYDEIINSTEKHCIDTLSELEKNPPPPPPPPSPLVFNGFRWEKGPPLRNHFPAWHNRIKRYAYYKNMCVKKRDITNPYEKVEFATELKNEEVLIWQKIDRLNNNELCAWNYD